LWLDQLYAYRTVTKDVFLDNKTARQLARPLAWHEYLKLFIPLESPCRVRTGQSMVILQVGDVLVMDNLKLHVVLDVPGSRLRTIVSRSFPDLI
jgi:hypothetical protein